MKSRIQWAKHKSLDKYQYPFVRSQRVAVVQIYNGKVKGCDFYIHIYGCKKYWCWTIRSSKYNCNLIVGGNYFKTVKETKKYAAKMAFVQFLRQIDRNIFKKDDYGYNTFCGVEPFER